MFEIGWTELLLIGIVALIVVGPKDLPMMFRTLGRFAAKLRAMGRDFSRAMEQAADETGVKDISRDIRAATNLRQTGIDALKDAATKFEAWDPKRTSPTAMAAAKPAEAAAAEAPSPEALAATANRGPYTAALARAQEAKRAELAATAAAARAGAAITAPAAAAAAPAPDRTPDTSGEG